MAVTTAAITVSFEPLGPEGHVTPQNLHNVHVMGVCNICIYPNIDDFKDIDLKLIST